MKTLILSALALTFGALLSSCNTMQGLGRDLQQGGQDLERSAEQTAR